MLLLIVVILGALYFMGENDDDDDDDDNYTVSAPLATFWVQQDSAGVYHIDVVKITSNHTLEDFSFYLKDEGGETYTGNNGFGEIAMQYMDFRGNITEQGLDMQYYGNDDQLRSRANNVSNDNGSEFPVHFSDNDRDGKLSAGDQFLVYGEGNSADGPAEDGWRLDIQFDPSGDIIGSAKLL